jgi:hypothetical protein
MRAQLQRIFMEAGTTTVLVSHDLEEAVYLADRVLLLSRHPSRVADYVRYETPRPRDDDTLSQPDFVTTKAMVRSTRLHRLAWSGCAPCSWYSRPSASPSVPPSAGARSRSPSSNIGR